MRLNGHICHVAVAFFYRLAINLQTAWQVSKTKIGKIKSFSQIVYFYLGQTVKCMIYIVSNFKLFGTLPDICSKSLHCTDENKQQKN